MNKSYKYFLAVITIIVLIWIIFNSGENWTLMVCKTKLNDAECRDNSYVIPDFKSKKECLVEGASKFAKEGFGCGKNCKENDYGLKVCKEICNSAGCSQ